MQRASTAVSMGDIMLLLVLFTTIFCQGPRYYLKVFRKTYKTHHCVAEVGVPIPANLMVFFWQQQGRGHSPACSHYAQ
ncbi:hypothetical protein E2C01_017445 [Portunus trituberculatus]|uniref:Uncharacterized protein n=1 Tax=Portunus trituberculatus TaxID=210409 RepID=A0A5B7DTG9_PORTR|nr:hypothetical protein [Portunus trituberculatus]